MSDLTTEQKIDLFLYAIEEGELNLDKIINKTKFKSLLAGYGDVPIRANRYTKLLNDADNMKKEIDTLKKDLLALYIINEKVIRSLRYFSSMLSGDITYNDEALLQSYKNREGVY